MTSTLTDPIADGDLSTAPGARRGWRLTDRADVEARRVENRGRLWLLASYVLCPCHLPVTMTVIAGVAGGTTVGAMLTASMWRLGAVFAVLYGLALWRGLHHLRSAEVAADRAECATGWRAVPEATSGTACS